MFKSKNRVESRVVRMFWNDGILDLLAGAGVLLMGVAWVFDLVPLGAIAPAVLIPFWQPLRTRITQPRLGYVELSEHQQQRHRTFLMTMIALGVLTLVGGVATYLFVVNDVQLTTRRTAPALPACIIGLMALMTGAITAQFRFVLYAAMMVLCGVGVAVLQLEPGWALLVGGVAVSLGGAITLWQFVTRYPLVAEGK